ncbi:MULTISPECIES: hypothetical protein [Planktothricoides]|uniref:Uncharacterized protein n=2 Tax=Planktothricoides raciborskii TaxID=132608 RepID=A0AAU8JKN5_9CYAN|nr:MULTISPECIES: hypothetical protein [Planktothricoides]MBD2543593.1 hypothetical protein [Planktothricoides raciborskii FACHB-1370]MBD2581283.1 hypothetical protein [Planktothricoides raciborskii FACHB-1261]
MGDRSYLCQETGFLLPSQLGCTNPSEKPGFFVSGARSLSTQKPGFYYHLS